jgi:hypothetical protein
MALKDCIKKLKGVVSFEDQATLQSFLDAGLNDEQAVRKLLLESDAKSIDISKRAAEAGATVANRPDFIGEILSLQKARAEKVRAERKKYAKERKELNDTYTDTNIIIDLVKVYWNTLPENQDGSSNQGLDINDDQDLNKVLSAMLFNPNMRENLNNGKLGLNGSTPRELVASFKELRDEKNGLRERLRELDVLDAQAVAQLEEMGSKGEDTFFQGRDVSDIGFRSGLLSAIRIMPQEKGSAAQMIAYLKKQPGVKKEELEWTEFESWAKAKGTITREEMIAYAEANGVQVQETQYGGQPIPRPEIYMEINDNKTTTYQNEGNFGAVYDLTNSTSTDTFEMYAEEDMGRFSLTEDGGKTWLDVPQGDFDNLPINLRKLLEYVRRLIISREKERSEFSGPAEFVGQWQLAGGTNYREVTLSLPKESFSTPEIDALNKEINKLGVEEMGSKEEKRYHKLANERDELVGQLKDNYTSHVFTDVKNILAWMRVKDRVGPNGEKILFVEEIQSDWHSDGREMGYAVPSDKAKLIEKAKHLEKRRITAYAEATDALIKIRKTGVAGGNARSAESRAKSLFWVETEVLHRSDWTTVLQGNTNELAGVVTLEEINKINNWRLATLELSQVKQQLDKVEGAIPDAPFKGNAWAELAMKRVIRMASEGGYDQVAWTTGEQQADRYDLGQVVNNIEYYPDPSEESNRRVTFNYVDGNYSTLSVGADGVVSDQTDDGMSNFFGKPLSEIIGKGMADKIMGDFPDNRTVATLTQEDLRVGGGEGMKQFYDQALPNIVNKAVKKLDKKARVKKFGGRISDTPGNAVYDPFDGYIGDEPTTVHAIDITPDIKTQAMEGLTLFQKERGSITFDEMRRGLIRLSETRDLSTFLHEAGHLYLETMRSLAEGPGAPQDIKDDWKIILDHLGVSAGREITRDHHELYAKTFEKYLSRGKAPSLDLQDSFNAYKRWMELIPGKLQELTGIELPPEITGVFDRIMASERQISEAELVQEYAAIFSTPEDMGISREAFDVYRKEAVRAHQDGVDRETAKMLDHMRRDEQAWWKVEKEKVRKEVTEEAHKTRVFIARAFLQHGTLPDGSPTGRASFKLDRTELISEYGIDFIKRLPGGTGKYGMSRLKGGVNPIIAAEILGYKSPEKMLEELIQTPSMKRWIRDETTDRMNKRFPDPMLDNTLSDNALKAVHNNRRASVLAIEMRALRELVKKDKKIVKATKDTLRRERSEARFANAASLPKKLEILQIRAAAVIAIGKISIRNLQPRTYLNAERRSGKLAFDASNSGDFQKAFKHKREQIINHEMYRAAIQAQSRVEKENKFLKKLLRPNLQKKYGKRGVLDSIMAVIGSIDFGHVTLKEMKRRDEMQKLAEEIHAGKIIVDAEIAEKLFTVSVDEKGNEVVTLNEGFRTNWRELSINQLMGMTDIVRQIISASEHSLTMRVNGEDVVIKDVMEEVANSIKTLHKKVSPIVGTKTGPERTKSWIDAIGASLINVGQVAKLLDKSDWGSFNKLVVAPIRRAVSERLMPMQQKASADLSNIWLKHFTRSELQLMGRKKFGKLNGREVSLDEVLSIALHQGSESNKEAFFGGKTLDGNFAYPQEEVQLLLSKLDSRHWKFVQEIWDYGNSYWPEFSATEKERRGIAPEKVEAVPFKVTTSDGKTMIMRGG